MISERVREDASEEAFRNEVCLETDVFLLLAVDTNPRRTVKTAAK